MIDVLHSKRNKLISCTAGRSDWQIMTQRAHCLFWYVPWAKNGSYIFKWLRNNQRKTICGEKIIRNSNFSVCKVLLAHSPHLCIVYGFICTTILVTELYRLWSLKHLLSGPLQKKCAPTPNKQSSDWTFLQWWKCSMFVLSNSKVISHIWLFEHLKSG